VIIDFADDFNARLPTGTTIAVAVDTGGCLIGSTTATSIASGSTTRVDSIGIAMIRNPDAAGTSAVTVTLTTPNGNRSLFSFSCTTPVP
jgi:hypothetical protein